MATNDVLKALLDNELLTDEVKEAVTEAFETIVQEQKTIAENTATKEAAVALNEALEESKTEMEAKVRTELAAKFVSERQELIASMDEKVMELLEVELSILKEDIESFRDLEVEMVAKLEDEKQLLADKFNDEKILFITKIDEFVEERLTVEIAELHEDIQSIKQNRAGMKMYEAFKSTHEDLVVDSDEHLISVTEKMQELKAEKDEILEIAEALGEKVITLNRSKALEETLSPLSGKRKAVMASILEGFDPEQFSAVYTKMITRVMDSVPVMESDVSVAEVVTEDDLPESVEIVDGNSRVDESIVEESVVDTSADERRARLKAVAGLDK